MKGKFTWYLFYNETGRIKGMSTSKTFMDIPHIDIDHETAKAFNSGEKRFSDYVIGKRGRNRFLKKAEKLEFSQNFGLFEIQTSQEPCEIEIKLHKEKLIVKFVEENSLLTDRELEFFSSSVPLLLIWLCRKRNPHLMDVMCEIDTKELIEKKKITIQDNSITEILTPFTNLRKFMSMRKLA